MADLTYAIGAGFVVHRSSARLNRSECERVLAYIDHTLSTSHDSELLASNRQSRAELLAAMAASFLEHREAAE